MIFFLLPMPFIASMSDERGVVFGEECSVGFRLSLSFNRGKSFKKWQCLKKCWLLIMTI